jgi:NAD(P)H-dependent flavin oxidoreductase YrpB (nitropropane dioxygenase family)
MRTTFCNLLGIELPIAQAAIGGAAVPALAAAVSNAGGLGTVTLTGHDFDSARQIIHQTRTLTSKPFCANFVLPYEGQFEDALEVALIEKVPVINLFWGDPALYVERVHAAGSLLLVQLGSVEEACHAAECGVDIIVAQGYGAGGHVKSEVGTLPLIANVLKEVTNTPVLAAGGISDGRGLAAVLALGAAGAYIGTRFLASEEASVAPEYIEHLLNAKVSDTVYTTLFDYGWPGAPHRALRNSTYRAWVEAGRPSHDQRPGKDDILATDSSGYEVRRYESYTATAELKGDIEALSLWAGQGVGLVNRVQPAADIVQEIASDARATIKNLATSIDT